MPPSPALRPERATPHRLADLATRLGLPDSPVSAEAMVTGITHDSSAVRPGDLYAALPGARRHGAQFAAEAVSRGATAVLTDPAGAAASALAGVPVIVADQPRDVLGDASAWVYDDPSADLIVIGVTGTNGKTTTAHLLEAGLRRAGHRTGLIGTIETRIGDERLDSVRTTPEATDLQALFAVMRERGVDSVAMEVSSHALVYGRVSGTSFAAGLFTNLSQDHLDFHGDMEAYFAAKARLFDGRCAHEVVNVDDPYGRRLVTSATVTVSAAGEPAAWRADDVATSPTGRSAFTVRGPAGEQGRTAVRSPGAFNVDNALLAIAALVTVGLPLEAAMRGTAGVDIPGRMEKVNRGQGFLAVVDYAHGPEAITQALAALRPMTPGHLIIVIGAGGDRDREKRPLMGAAAAQGADLVIVTDDNPRSEDPAAIRAAVAGGARGGPAELVTVGDRAEAIAVAVAAAGPGDTVLLAGKGHEQGQEVAGVVHAFDDRLVLADALDAVIR